LHQTQANLDAMQRVAIDHRKLLPRMGVD